MSGVCSDYVLRWDEMVRRACADGDEVERWLLTFGSCVSFSVVQGAELACAFISFYPARVRAAS